MMSLKICPMNEIVSGYSTDGNEWKKCFNKCGIKGEKSKNLIKIQTKQLKLMNSEDQHSFELEEFYFQMDLGRKNSRLIDNWVDIFDFGVMFSKKESSQIQDNLLQKVQLQKPEKLQKMDEQEVLMSNTSNVSTSAKSESSSQSLFRKCNCTRSRCLKNYCECFKLGIKCNEQCECKDCRNCVQLFLLPSQVTVEKIRCKCKKSKCLKKYCECHSAGKKCGESCACTDCENGEQIQEENGEIRKRVKSDPLLEYQQYLN